MTSVYQFEDAAQAEFYLEDGLITIGGYGGSFFDIEGQPGVRGFAQSFTDEGEELISLGAAFQVGPRWFLTYIVGSPESVTPAMLLPVVEEQRRGERRECRDVVDAQQHHSCGECKDEPGDEHR